MVSKAAQAAYEQRAEAAKVKAAAAGASLTKHLAHAERKIVAMKSNSQYFDEEDLAVMPKYEFIQPTKALLQ